MLPADSTIAARVAPPGNPAFPIGSYKQHTFAQRSSIEHLRTMCVASVRDTPRSPLGLSISSNSCSVLLALVQEKHWTRVCGALAEAEQTERNSGHE
jgi:hypothetical protein